MAQNTQLKKLSFKFINLSSLEPELFARVVNRLEDVNLARTNITDVQIQALFTIMAQNTRLKKLNLSCLNLSSLEPELFASLVTRLEDVNLYDTDITNVQIQALFTEMSQNSHLKKLDLKENNLSSLEPELFARVVTRLEDVNLDDTDITDLQIQVLFTAMVQNTRLKNLNLRSLNLSSLEPKLFARVMTRIENVNLARTNITYVHIQALFTEMSENSHLKKLNISSNNLSSLEPELFVRVVTRLEDVDLYKTDITDFQIRALFTAMAQNTQLKKLSLKFLNLSSLEPQLFARMVTRLEDVDLSSTNITYVQIQALFTEMSQNSRLKKLDLEQNNLSSVDKVVLGTAVTKLEEVGLSFTKLSTEQITSILTQIQEDTKIKELVLWGNETEGIDLDVVRNARKNLGGGLFLVL